MDTKIDNYVIIAILKSESLGKLINRIPGSSILISSLPDSALRTLIESPNDSISVLKAEPVNLDIKGHVLAILGCSLICWIYGSSRKISVQITYMSNKGSGEPVHLHSLTRLSTSNTHKEGMCTYIKVQTKYFQALRPTR